MNLKHPRLGLYPLMLNNPEELESDVNAIFIAEDSSKLIGYSYGTANYNYKTPFGAIVQISVSPSYMKKGIGSTLLNSLIDWFQEKNLSYARVLIPSRAPQKPLFQLFGKKGFKIVETLNVYKRKVGSFPIGNPPSWLEVVDVKDGVKSDTLDQLTTLEEECFNDFWKRSYESFERNIRRAIDEPNEVSFYIALSPEKKVIGYNYNTYSVEFEEGQYVRIAVSPNYRGLGIAHHLTYHAFQWFLRRGAKTIVLTTHESEQYLNIMYQNWRFKLTGHAYPMKLDL